MLSSAGTTSGNLLLTSTGRLRLRLDGTVIGADSAPLVPGTTYVVGLHQKRGTGSNGVLEAFLAAGRRGVRGTLREPDERHVDDRDGPLAHRRDQRHARSTSSSTTSCWPAARCPPAPLRRRSTGIIAVSAPGVAQPGALLATATVASRPRYSILFVCPI